MMRAHVRFSWCLALAVLSAGGAEASCASFIATPVWVSYNPLGTQGSEQVNWPIIVTAASGDGSPTGVDAQFVDHNSGVPHIGSAGPVYTITKSLSPVVVPLGSPFNPSYAFHHEFRDAGHRRPELVGAMILRIDPAQDVAAGVYFENLDIQYQCSGTGRTDMQSGVLQLVVDVPSTLTASLAGGSSSGTIDFGDFSTLTQTAMVGVSSTGPYAVRITSTNGQVMKLTTPPPGVAGAANAQIPYTVTFAGTAVSSTPTRFSRTGVGGTHLPLSITAGPVGAKRAGTYHDIITVTFTPLATL